MNNEVKKRAPRCVFCKKVKHKKDCTVLLGIEGIDYLKCKICKFNFRELKAHYNRFHPLETSPIEKSEITFKKRSKAQKGKENWVSKYKKENSLLYEEKISKMKLKVSEVILKNEAERKRRSESLSNLWKNPKFRQNNIISASKTAELTSQRPEILKQRSDRLEKWRNENPDLFFKKCIVSLCQNSSFKSKGEELLFNWIKKEFSNLDFKRNQFEYNENFTTKTKKRQIDIKSKKLNMLIEFDGSIHFKNNSKKVFLQKIKNKDDEFNLSLKEKFLIVRISYDVLNYKKTYIKDEYLDQLKEIIKTQINEKKTGLILIGKKYAKSNIV